MKRYIYSLYTEDFEPCTRAMVASVQRHAPDTYVITERVDVPSENGLCSMRIERIAALADTLASDGGDDVLLMLDGDVYVQADPFGMFAESGADVILASRQYECKYPTNGGVQGYRLNERGIAFLRHYAAQLITKDWPPFYDFQRLHGRAGRSGYNWLDDQDYLCAAFIEALAGRSHPTGATVGIVNPKWNWTEPYDGPEHRFHEKCAERLRRRIGDPGYPMLHFKGGFKRYMPETGGAVTMTRAKV